MSPLALASLGGALPPQFSLADRDDAEPAAGGGGAGGGGAGGGGGGGGGGEESSAGAVDMWACGCVLACLLWRAGAGSPSTPPPPPQPAEPSSGGLPPLAPTGGCLAPLADCPSEELRAVLEARRPTLNPFTATQPFYPYPKPKPNPNYYNP